MAKMAKCCPPPVGILPAALREATCYQTVECGVGNLGYRGRASGSSLQLSMSRSRACAWGAWNSAARVQRRVSIHRGGAEARTDGELVGEWRAGGGGWRENGGAGVGRRGVRRQSTREASRAGQSRKPLGHVAGEYQFLQSHPVAAAPHKAAPELRPWARAARSSLLAPQVPIYGKPVGSRSFRLVGSIDHFAIFRSRHISLRLTRIRSRK